MKLIKSNKGSLELDELGKVIIGLTLLIILIVIVTVVIGPEFGNQGDKVDSIFGMFK